MITQSETGTPLVAVSKINVGERARKEMGDLVSLAESIREVGLLHPICLTPDNRLIAGQRRLAAVKMLGWTAIAAHYVDLDCIVKGERDENVLRKPFTPSEVYEITREILEVERAAARKRQGTRTDLEHSETVAQSESKPPEKRAKEKAAEAVGVSRPHLAKIEAVMEAAEEEPEEYSDIVKSMDEDGNVSAAFRELKHRKRKQTIRMKAKKAKPVEGHRVIHADNMLMIEDGSVDLICTDPPYNISKPRVIDFTDRGSMSNDFGDWDHFAHKDFLWMLDGFARASYRVLREGGSVYVFCGEAYASFLRLALIKAGFSFKNLLVWHRANPKPKPDKTSYVAGSDFVCFAVKGENHTFNYTSHAEMSSVTRTPICQGTERQKWGHPTQKPVKLMEKYIETSSDPGDVVIDPFAGSGTTGEACQNTGRRFVLIEQRAEYIAMIEARTGVKRDATTHVI